MFFEIFVFFEDLTVLCFLKGKGNIFPGARLLNPFYSIFYKMSTGIFYSQVIVLLSFYISAIQTALLFFNIAFRLI